MAQVKPIIVSIAKHFLGNRGNKLVKYLNLDSI